MEINGMSKVHSTPSLQVGPPPVYEGSGVGIYDDSYSSTSIDVPYPSIVNENDILIVHMVQTGYGTNSIPTAPGWNLLLSGNNQDVRTYAVLWRRADGTETGSVTFTKPSTSYNGISAIINRYSGCVETGNPYENLQGFYALYGTTLASQVNQASLGDNRLSVCMYGGIPKFNPSFTLTRTNTVDYVEVHRYQPETNLGMLITDHQEIVLSGSNDGLVYYNSNISIFHLSVRFMLIPK